MARRKEHTHEEIREMAITAVVDHLEQDQLSSLSLRKVATAIGYVPSTLINIFGRYQVLLLSVSELTLQQLHQSLKLVDEQDNAEAIVAMARVYSRFALAHPHRFNLVFELKMLDDHLPPLHNKLIKELFGLVEWRLASLFNHHEQQELQKHSRVIWAGIHGLTCLALDDKLFIEDTTLDDLLHCHVDSHLTAMGYQKDLICC
ncbi:WHG domain-containing protein [Shewanella mesophila]|uniref:TetR-like C-terminal domain-containing protein n=1 Tax=Shewanella mesophila TaxID=2864208 RepID=UPI001C655C6A|nr:TetR-like C-terminal domain-containing protein [Shewanella mesophila]QYJ86306.1 WHG domain-containing protein [Shewanella mesophila]